MKIRQSIKTPRPSYKKCGILNSNGAALQRSYRLPHRRTFSRYQKQNQLNGNSSKNIFRSEERATSAFAPFFENDLNTQKFSAKALTSEYITQRNKGVYGKKLHINRKR